ncbi:transcription factor atoh8 isoform X2 [Salminus brasiliensis]|uniref:transcription factor atoh8 isoform X2 n=1 Tax=Salminus brasiliensis TaxID=930266 RepID=UPI003B837EFB
MKNHVIMDQCSPDGNKKFKRKVRGSFKREIEEKDKHTSETLQNPMGCLVDDVYGNICGKSFVPAPSSTQHLHQPSFLNGVLDKKMCNFPSVTGNVTETKPRSISEEVVELSDDKTSPVFESEHAFPKGYAQQSRIVLCKRSERSLSSTSRAALSVESTDSSRKRLGESSGVVTEIKAIQQTRRLLANARERTRVHTISAAFEALRKQVPCYSYGQKLSKLAILRIACNYILSLAQLADLDYTPDHSNMSFRECVEQCTRTLQAEGRSKKRKAHSEGN